LITPLCVKGKYNEALVYAKALESVCEDKIRQYLDHPVFTGTTVRIMPDVHPGKGTVIGWTATYGDKIIPSVIGLDIGCGVCACNLGRGKLAFDKLDKFIRKTIPSGQNVRAGLHGDFNEINLFISEFKNNAGFSDGKNFPDSLTGLCGKLEKDPHRIFNSFGTLGGGNHFIEIDNDENHNRWLLVHTGSRILGAYTAGFHEAIALQETDAENKIKYLTGNYMSGYLEDLRIVQHYAAVNRALVTQTISKDFFGIDIRETEYLDCAHNFIDATKNIIRKGAISAEKDEPVVIPFSMAEGAVLGKGNGNAAWNFSAPHGSGRKKTRTDARALSLDEYRKEMRGIWSSVIRKDTLEESPMVYKKARDILEFIDDTVTTEHRLKPLYNYKAVE